MHLAQLHHSSSSSSPATPTTNNNNNLFSSSTSSTINKNTTIAFLLGTLLGLLLATSFLSISPHQFHTDISTIRQEELTAKLISLAPAQKRKILQDVFMNSKFSSSSSSSSSSSKLLLATTTKEDSNAKQNEDLPEELQDQSSTTGENANLMKNSHFFPLFEPVPKKPEKILKYITRTMWADVDVRAVRKDFGQAGTDDPAVVADEKTNKKKKIRSPSLPWTWINVRPHINALPALTKSEVLKLWPSQKLLKKMSTSRTLNKLFGSDENNNSASYFFPVFLQTKYGYRGDSIAVVGGLFEPSTDKSLHQTAKRELREELGVECSTLVSHGRFVNDANRGCGNFESFFAKNCVRVEQSKDDKAAKDSESQQLLLFTRDDLIELLANTRRLAKLTEFPYLSIQDAYSFENTSSSSFSSLSVKKQYFQDFGKERQDLERNSGNGQVVNHGMVLKECKWISTISMTLLALENE